MDNIKSKLENLPELSDGEIGELEADISSQFDTFAGDELSAQGVDAMTELADMLDTVRTEVSRREAEAESLAARAVELSARVKGEEPAAKAEVEVEEEDVPEKESSALEASATLEAEVEVSSDSNTEASVEDVAEVEAPAEAEAASKNKDDEEEDDEESEEDSDKSKKKKKKENPFAEASVEEVEPVADATDTSAAEASAEDETSSPEETTTETELAAEDAVEEVAVEAEASTTETTIEPEAQKEEAQTVTASAEGAFEAPADRRPVAQAPEAATVAITAGADIPGVSAGSTLSTEGVAKAFSERLHTLRRAHGGDGEQHIVASFTTDYPEERYLNGTADENWGKITQSGEDRQAIVASGGYGTPVETKFDIFGFGSDARPVKDSLPKFLANRGGIRYVKPPVLSSYASAVGVWTEANDVSAGSNDGTASDTLKNSLTVSGATEATAGIDAVTLQLQIGNLLTRAYPELVARHNELALIQHAREAELNILAKIESASTAVTTTSTIGFARDFLVNVRLSATAYRSRHRIAPDTRLQAIIPMWVIDAIAADLTLNMPGDDNLNVGLAEIRSMLESLNVSLTASYDQNTFTAQAAGALDEFPDEFTWFLFSEGSFLFLDGGNLDIGIVRDSALVNTNDYRMFVETFEGVAFVGIESLAITSTIVVNGVAAALATGSDY